MRFVNGLCNRSRFHPVYQLASAFAQRRARCAVKDGGIFAKGWMGKIDAQEEKAGQVLNNARLDEKGGTLHGRAPVPAVTYWNPANKAAGNYTVSATFNEANYMGLMDHPHPYGIVIGGNDLGTETQSYIYCSAYGNGTFIVRGMGPAPFAVSARKPEPNAAIAKAAGKGSAGQAGHRGDGDRRQDRVLGQRHGGRQLPQGRRRRAPAS